MKVESLEGRSNPITNQKAGSRGGKRGGRRGGEGRPYFYASPYSAKSVLLAVQVTAASSERLLQFYFTAGNITGRTSCSNAPRNQSGTDRCCTAVSYLFSVVVYRVRSGSGFVWIKYICLFGLFDQRSKITIPLTSPIFRCVDTVMMPCTPAILGASGMNPS